MRSILNEGAANIPQTNRKRLQQQTAGFGELTSAYYTEFMETSDVFSRKNEEDYYNLDELRAKASELASERPDILQTIKGESALSDDDFIRNDPIGVINSINPAAMNDITETAQEKLKSHIETTRQHTETISQRYQEGGGSWVGELGAGVLAYSGTGEGLAQIALGAGLSGLVGNVAKSGALTAGRIGQRAFRVGTAEGAISFGLEVPLATSEYKRDMELGLDPEYARNNYLMRLLAAPTFGFGVSGIISYGVDKVRFRGGTTAILSEGAKQQIYKAFEITGGKVGALEAVTNINRDKGKLKTDSGKAARWADEIERNGNIKIAAKDLSDSQKSNIRLVDGEGLEIGDGGSVIKRGDQVIIGKNEDEVAILSKADRDKHNIKPNSQVLFHGSLREWDSDSVSGSGGLYATPEAAEVNTSGYGGLRRQYGNIIPQAKPTLYKVEVDNAKWISDTEALPDNVKTKIRELQDELDSAHTAIDRDADMTAAGNLQSLFDTIIYRYGENSPKARAKIAEVLEDLDFTGIKAGDEYTIFSKGSVREIAETKQGKILYNKPAQVMESKGYKTMRITQETIEDNLISEEDLKKLRHNAEFAESTNERGEVVETLYFNEDVAAKTIDDDLLEEFTDNNLFAIHSDDMTALKRRYAQLLAEKFPNVDKAEINRRVNEIDKAKLHSKGGVETYNLANASDVWLVALTHPEELFGNGDFINQIGMRLDGNEITTITIDDDGLAFMGSRDGGRLVREKLTDLFNKANDEGLMEGGFITNKNNSNTIGKIIILDTNDKLPEAGNATDITRLANEYSNGNAVLFDSGKEGNSLFIKKDELAGVIGLENIAKIAIAGKVKDDIALFGQAPRLTIAKALMDTFDRFGDLKGIKKKINREKLIRDVIDLDDDIDFMNRVGINNYTKIIKALDMNADNELTYGRIQYYTRAIYRDAKGNAKTQKALKRENENFINALLYKAEQNGGKLVMNADDVKFYRLAASELDYNEGIIRAGKNLSNVVDRSKFYNYTSPRAKAFITALYKGDFDNFDKEMLDKLSKIKDDAELQTYMLNNIERAPFDYDEGKIVVGNKLFNIVKDDSDDFVGVEKTDTKMYKGKPMEAIPILENLEIGSGGSVHMNVLYGGATHDMRMVGYTIKKASDGKYVLKKNDEVLGKYNTEGDAKAGVLKNKYGSINKHDRANAEYLFDGGNTLAHIDFRTNKRYIEDRVGDTINLYDESDNLLKRFENTEEGKNAVIDYLNIRNLVADDVKNKKKLVDDMNACLLKVGGK